MKGSKFHTGVVKKRVLIKAPASKVWKKVSNIVGLPEWIDEIKKATYLSKTKRGVGAIRRLVFDDKNVIDEHVVAWKGGQYFSYIAVNGLPLRAYYATISIQPKGKEKTLLTWQSYFNSKKMTRHQFNEFVSYLESFYEKSLQNLKSILEYQK